MKTSKRKRRKGFRRGIYGSRFMPLFGLGLFLFHFPLLFLTNSCQGPHEGGLLPLALVELPKESEQEREIFEIEFESETPKRFWANHLLVSNERVRGPFQVVERVRLRPWNGWRYLSDREREGLVQSGPRETFRLTLMEEAPDRDVERLPPRREPRAFPQPLPRLIVPITEVAVPEPSQTILIALGLFAGVFRRSRPRQG